MKRKATIVLSLLLMCLCCFGLEAKAVTLKSMKTTIYLKPGERKKIRIKGYKRLPNWKAKNRNVVISPKKGFVQALAAGKTKVYAKVKKKRVRFTIVVMEKNTSRLALKQGTSGKLKVKYGGKKVKWKSSDTSVAKVSNGVVKAKGPGKATIKATAHGRSFKFKINVPKVTITTTSLVASPPPEYGIVASKSVAYIKVKNNVITPTYASSDPAVATVDANGCVTALKKGTVTISAYVDSLVFQSTVKISDRPVDIYLNYAEKYSKYVKKHGKYCKRADTCEKSFQDVKKKINQNKTALVNCRAHATWAFYDMGLTKKGIWAKEGSFSGKFKGIMTTYLTRMTEGAPIGKTFRECVDAGLLRPGDICAFKDQTHTFTYTGVGYECYDGGLVLEMAGYENVGLRYDYSKKKYYNNKVIGEILRWNY